MKWLAIIILSCFAFGCIDSNLLSAKETKRIQNEVIKTLENYSSDVNFNGLTAEFKYLDSSSSFYWVPPGYRTRLSYDSVKKILIMNAPTLQLINNRYVDVQVDPIASNYATYTARMISHTEDTAGNKFASELLETGMMIKDKDGWKLRSGHTSLIGADK